MEILDHGARTGTAGFVLARLLLEPPSQVLAENFGTPRMRQTWPLHDPASAAALAGLEPEPYERLPREHASLFRRRQVAPHESAWRPEVERSTLLAELARAYERANFTGLPTPVDDHLGFQVAYLAHLATVIGRAGAAGEHDAMRSAATTATRFRAAHLDLVVDQVLTGIESYAGTSLYRALPGLLRGFLAELEDLCATALDHQPA